MYANRYTCSFRGHCEPHRDELYSSEAECQENCQGRPAPELSYLIYQYLPEELPSLAPSDQEELLHQWYGWVPDDALEFHRLVWLVSVYGVLDLGPDDINRVYDATQVTQLGIREPSLAEWNRDHGMAPIWVIPKGTLPEDMTSNDFQGLSSPELTSYVAQVYPLDMQRWGDVIEFKDIDSIFVRDNTAVYNGQEVIQLNREMDEDGMIPPSMPLNQAPTLDYWLDSIRNTSFWIDIPNITLEVRDGVLYLGPYPTDIDDYKHQPENLDRRRLLRNSMMYVNVKRTPSGPVLKF
jgi:hypothetical protein